MAIILLALLAEDLLYVQAGESLRWYAVDGSKLTLKGSLPTPGESPNYLRATPDGRFLYAASPAAKLLVFAIGADGGLTPKQELASPGGPCYVDVDPSGRWAATANYGSGKTLLFPGPREWETGPQTHSARFHPGGKFLYALSVGGRKITRLALDGGAPWTLEMPGLGPRHVAFSPKGKLAFVVHERPIRVSSLRVAEGSGALEPIGTWPALEPGAVEKPGLAAAEIAVAGGFVYASVRDFSKEGGLDGLAAYAVEASGALKWVEYVPTGGVSPRGFVFDPPGTFCYVLIEIPGTLKTFRVDSGRLTPAGDPLPLGGKSIGIAWARLP